MSKRTLSDIVNIATAIAGAAILASGGGWIAGFFKLAALQAGSQFIQSKLAPRIVDPAESPIDAATQTIVASETNARWIFGRARVGGQLVYAVRGRLDPKELNLVFVLSEGDLDGIEKVWVNGEEVGLRRRGKVLFGTGEYEGRIAVVEEFTSNFGGGQTQRGSTIIGEGDWNTDYDLTGTSYAHVLLSQNNYGDDFNSTDSTTPYRTLNFWLARNEVGACVFGAEGTMMLFGRTMPPNFGIFG